MKKLPGNRLKEILREKHITYQQVADMLEVPVEQIYKWTKNTEYISYDMAVLLSFFLKVDKQEFLLNVFRDIELNQEVYDNLNSLKWELYMGVASFEAIQLGEDTFIVRDRDGELLGTVPAEEFYQHYLKIRNPDKIMSQDIDKFIDNSTLHSIQIDDNTVITSVTIPTGFKYCKAMSTLSDTPLCTIEKYNLQKLKHDIRHDLGFVLKWAMNGLKPNKRG